MSNEKTGKETCPPKA